MPLPVINYAALPPSGDRAAAGELNALQQGFQMGILPFKEKADMKQQQLANALAQAQLQYYPQQAQSGINAQNSATNRNNIEAQYLPQDMQSQINARTAQTGLTNQQAKFLPLDKMIDAVNSQRQNSRFGNAYQLSKALGAMPQATRDIWIAQNQEKYSDMINTMATQAGQNQGTQGGDIIDKAMQQFFPGMMQKLPQSPNQQANLAANAPPGSFTTTPEQVAQLRNASQISANNSLVTGKTRNQLEGAIQVGSVMSDPGFRQRAMNASQYAGAAGMGKSALDSLKKTNPQAYSDYQTFKSTDMVLLLNRIKMLDGLGATDAQRDELHGLYNAINPATSNPTKFLQQLDNLGRSIDTVSKSVTQSAQPLGGPSRVQSYVPLSGGNTSVSGNVRKYNPQTGRIE
jgi:hypothetical protein